MAAEPEQAPAPRPVPKKFTIHFKDAKWDDVFDWYAKETGLVLITTVKPTGTTSSFVGLADSGGSLSSGRGGSVAGAARLAGISRPNFHKKLKSLGVDPERFKSAHRRGKTAGL